MKQKRNKEKINDEVVECIYTDKRGIKITLDMLEKLLEKANTLKKIPFLRIAIRRNDKENVILDSSLRIEKK